MNAEANLRIAVAVISYHDRLILQLRDFRPDIADPGEWGFFGGHVRPDEEPVHGLRRELLEEIGWSPQALRPLGSFQAEGHSIIGYASESSRAPDDLLLGEGQELGAFDSRELATGAAYSHRWARRFPLTRITRHALHVWLGITPLTTAEGL